MSLFLPWPEPFRTVISESAIRLDHAEQYGSNKGWATLSQEAGVAVEILTTAIEGLSKVRQPERYPFRIDFTEEEMFAIRDALYTVQTADFIFLNNLSHQPSLTSNFIQHLQMNKAPECSEMYEYLIPYLRKHLEALKALSRAAVIFSRTLDGS